MRGGGATGRATMVRTPVVRLPGARLQLRRQCGHEFRRKQAEVGDGTRIHLTATHPILEHGCEYGTRDNGAGSAAGYWVFTAFFDDYGGGVGFRC